MPVQASKMPKVKPEKLYVMQNQIFETGDTELVWRAVISTLYDSDFLIEDIDMHIISPINQHYNCRQ